MAIYFVIKTLTPIIDLLDINMVELKEDMAYKLAANIYYRELITKIAEGNGLRKYEEDI